MKGRLVWTLVFLLVLAQGARAQYDKDVFFFRGRTALSEGKYSEAIAQFNVLANLDPNDYWTFFFRGIAKYNLGDYRGAYQDFDYSISVNPVFTDGYHYRAITRSRFGNYDEALADLESAINLRPGFVGLYFSRGVTYFLAQQFENAVADFDRYIRREPRDPSAYLNRGASYLYMADTTKALADYNRAIRLDRFEPEGYIRRGRLYADQKKYKQALADMDRAIELDSTNTFAFFNRALMYYETNDYNAAMRDLNRVLRDEPGNALTLYNRALISAQVGDYESALADMDRVININPGNVLAYYNRAAFFIEMERWRDALDDYTKAIELYPDFAKAYMNRSYVENMLGRTAASRADYQTAQQKVAEYRAKNAEQTGSFADTTRKYSSLLALDADFAKKDFDNELLQHRDIDIRLRPLFRFRLTRERGNVSYALRNRFEHPLVDKFIADAPTPLTITNVDTLSGSLSRALLSTQPDFIRGLYELQNKQYNQAQVYFDRAIEAADAVATDVAGSAEAYYRSFYRMNRGVLRAEMIDFIASIQSNVQTLTMDDKGTIRARVGDQVTQTYDYSEAIADMEEAAALAPDIPYFYYNLGNLYCLSSQLVEAIGNYDKAIELYPAMGDAYYNRGLVLIYLKDKEKGCIDLSRSGELGVAEAYGVISKYCEEEQP